MDRETGDLVAQPRTEPFFGFHHANAYEDGEEIVVDLETVPDVASIDRLYLDELRTGNLDVFGGRLERFRVRLDEPGGAVDRRMIYDGGTALPTVSPARWCREHRYVYAQGTDQPVTTWPQSVLKIDTASGTAREFSDSGNHFSEPIFVPRPDATAADDGVVLTVMLDDDAERSVIVVLDGESFSELARAPVPHPIPFDFHGRFFAELT
jgi:beta-carotene 15,15'-monooxygenase